MSRYSTHLDQNNSTICIFSVHILFPLHVPASPHSSHSLTDLPSSPPPPPPPPPPQSVPARLCKFAPDNSGRSVPTAGVVAAAAAVTACYPAGVMAARLPLSPSFLPSFLPLFPPSALLSLSFFHPSFHTLELGGYSFASPLLAHFRRPSFAVSVPLSQLYFTAPLPLFLLPSSLHILLPPVSHPPPPQQ